MSDEKKPKAPVVEAHGPRRAVEKIAFERDMLPEFKPGLPPASHPRAVVPPVHNPRFAVFTRAKHFHRWVIGQELTDQEFDEAIAASEKASVYR